MTEPCYVQMFPVLKTISQIDCIINACDYAFIFTVIVFLELLTIQSGEENKFVIDYSSEVWKNSPPVIVWLGMYYDSNSKCPENLLASFITN